MELRSQHVGSRYTQVGDQAAGFGSVDLTAVAPLLHLGTFIGGPLRQNAFVFNPELPAYNDLNTRIDFLTTAGRSPSSSTTQPTSGRSWPSTRSGARGPGSAI